MSGAGLLLLIFLDIIKQSNGKLIILKRLNQKWFSLFSIIMRIHDGLLPREGDIVRWGHEVEVYTFATATPSTYCFVQ